MIIINQLRTLDRLFPHATEFAVTTEQVTNYLCEMTQAERHQPSVYVPSRTWKSETLPNGVLAISTNIYFRGRRLVIVESAR